MVRLEDRDGSIVGQVKGTRNLDHWDGNNWSCGSTGQHLGIRKIIKGKYKGNFALVHETQWIGKKDYAEVITPEEAQQVVARHNPDLLESLGLKTLERVD